MADTVPVERRLLGEDLLAEPVELLELRGAPGPETVLLLGGVHGDEPEGVLAVRSAVARLARLALRGTVLAVPVANPSAWATGRRCSPLDGANLARCFPGDPAGGESARLAHVLTEAALSRATVVVDLHSAGADYAMPLFAGALASGAQGPESVATARALGLPLVWEHDAIGPGRTLSAADALGIPAVYVECGGRGAVRGGDLDACVAGLLRVLARLGMVDAAAAGVASVPPPPLTLAGDDGDVDAGIVSPVDGWCVVRREAGEPVAAGEVVAELLEQDGSVHCEVRAPRDGTVAMVRHRAAIAAGELVCMIGPVAS